jgi:hypothetical protein
VSRASRRQCRKFVCGHEAIDAELDAIGDKVRGGIIPGTGACLIEGADALRLARLIRCHHEEARWLLDRHVGLGGGSFAALVLDFSRLHARYFLQFERMWGPPDLEGSYIAWHTPDGDLEFDLGEQLQYMFYLELERVARVDSAAKRHLQLHRRLDRNLRRFAENVELPERDCREMLERYRTVTKGKGDPDGYTLWTADNEDDDEQEALAPVITLPVRPNAPGGAA